MKALGASYLLSQATSRPSWKATMPRLILYSALPMILGSNFFRPVVFIEKWMTPFSSGSPVVKYFFDGLLKTIWLGRVFFMVRFGKAACGSFPSFVCGIYNVLRNSIGSK